MRALVASLVLLAGLSGPWPAAFASPSQPAIDTDNRYAIDLPANVERQEPKHDLLLAHYVGPAGLRLVISRIEYPNLPAYWRDDKQAFFAQLERGLQEASRGYKRRKSKAHRVDKVPVFDVEFSRRHQGERQRVCMRFLLHRRFAIVATAVAPEAASKSHRDGRRVVSSLRPPPKAPASNSP